ncbi:hypothetical protein CNMCM8714_007773 [Aspergillus fumigatus]|nr:hypothetical protein CNMCM8714_007773 [Aspergillus fumigatus]
MVVNIYSEILPRQATETTPAKGVAEDGAVEDGAVEDGAVEDGAVEDGAVENGVADDSALKEAVNLGIPLQASGTALCFE